MSRLEFKAVEPFELQEFNTERRTAVIAHAVYDTIDSSGDIARRGMFNKSWKEHKAIKFLIDHNPALRPGIVTNVYEDERKAYTKVKFSQSTLGTDTMYQMDEGIITGASFGFYTIKANPLTVKGKKIRELKEVIHDETTVALEMAPVNKLAGVVKVNKADSRAVAEFKAHIERIEKFCRNSKASDETIEQLEAEVKAARELLSSYDTPDTQLITEQSGSSDESKEFANHLHLLTLKI
jgi:HK97 family phage prohead protease